MIKALQTKNVIVEEELDCIDIDDIRGFTKLAFIDEEFGDLILVNDDDAELTRNINQKKKSDILHQPIDAHSVTNVVSESIYSVTTWNIYCELVR